MVPDEFKNKKVLLTWGTIGTVIGVAFFAGSLYTKQVDTNKEVDNMKKDLKELVIQEVGGLRADWERDKKEQDKKIERLETKTILK